MYSFPDLEPVCYFMSSSNCCFLPCIQISQEADQVVRYSHFFKNFAQFVVIHTVKGFAAAAAAAKSLQSCPTLCNLIDGSPPGSPVPGILQARTLEWVAISFSNAWKWKCSHSVLSDPQRPHGQQQQPSRLLCPWDFPGKSTGVECHCLLHYYCYRLFNVCISMRLQ